MLIKHLKMKYPTVSTGFKLDCIIQLKITKKRNHYKMLKRQLFFK